MVEVETLFIEAPPKPEPPKNPDEELNIWTDDDDAAGPPPKSPKKAPPKPGKSDAPKTPPPPTPSGDKTLRLLLWGRAYG